MDTIWTIMSCIVYGFELVGFGVIVLWIITMIFDNGDERIDKIRRYMLMQDED